jgi:alkaline phosphatase D
LSNYRELYKTYRSDPDLQAVHERFPMMAVWDDHEFSDDSWGATATYFDGALDEHDLDRRKAANQAWFEYMPTDYNDNPDFRYDPDVDFPDDLKIWRDFTFGQHLHLVLTDLRSRRTDHVIPENAFPGAIAATEEDLDATLGEIPAFAVPYIDVATFADGIYQTALEDVAPDRGWAEGTIAGNLSVPFVNNEVTALNEDLPEDQQIPLISEEDQALLPRGLAFFQAGKRGQYTSLGSRYLAVAPVFRAYADVLWDRTEGASEHAMGEEQQAWFLETMRTSDRTWKVWGNEYCLIPHAVDLSAIESLPEGFRQRFFLLLDDWTGMPNRRDEVIRELADVETSSF